MTLQKMKIAAKEYFRKGDLLPFVSWKIDSVTTFGDHQVEFDLVGHQVIRSAGGGSEIIAQIHSGSKGSKLTEFFGTVESEDFIVTKRKKDWFSGLTGNVVFEINLKDGGVLLTNMAMRYDFYNSFRVGDILDLKLTRDDRARVCRLKIEGTCAAEHQALGEVIACLLLHHNEEMDSI